MALQSIKSVIQNKGYLIEQKDRAIFELGDLQSFFGFSQNDAIEFIVYDSNDNQLPQINGELVRYIPLSTENINDYFLIPTGTVFQKYQLPKEYFIDVERLLREAGYNNGIFKTQITLINKRVGSEFPYDKLWISEISPSRTEIRLFPLIKNQPKELLDNLKQRFDAFVRNKKFREDYINQAFAYIEQINPSQVGSFIKTKYGEDFFNTMVNEYKISSFDAFVTNIHKTFMEACIYEFTNRISDVNNINYGKPKTSKPKATLNNGEIQSSIQKILTAVLNKYLPIQDVRETSTFDLVTDESIDEVSNILKTTSSDVLIDSKEIPIKKLGVLQKTNDDKSEDLKRLLIKQLPLESDVLPPKIIYPTDEIQPIEVPPVKIDIIPIEEFPIKEYPRFEIPSPDVIMPSFPESDVRFQNLETIRQESQQIQNQQLAGGGFSNAGRGIVIDRNRGEINYDNFFNNQIENIQVQE